MPNHICSRSYAIFAGFIAIALFVSGAHAQGTQADYDRAASFDARTRNKVTSDTVHPHWSPDGNSFWYWGDGSGANRPAWQVDAVNGTRRPATPDERKAFVGVSLPDLGRPQRSSDGGGEARIAFVNHTAGPVDYSWIAANGDRKKYGTVPPGGRQQLGTFSGHVWIVTDANGKTLGVFRAEDGANEAIIETDRSLPNRRGQRNADQPNDAPPHATSADGARQASVRDGNVFVQQMPDGKPVELSHDGGKAVSYEGDSFYFSPDAKYLVVNRTEAGEEHKVYEVQSSPPDQRQPKLVSFDYYKPGDKLPVTKPRLFDVAAGKEVAIDDASFKTPYFGDGEKVRWSADSKRFTFYYNQRGHQVARVIAVDAATGHATTIVDEQARTFVNYYANFFLQFVGDDELIWMSERDGWNHLYLYDANTGRVKNSITKGQWVVRGVDHVDAKARQIYFRAGGIDPKQDPYYLHVCRVNFDGTGLVDLTPGDGTHAVQWSPDRRFYVDTYSRVDLPPVNELRRATDGHLLCPLESGDASALLKTGWRYPERFVAKARDGTTDIYGVIYRPTNFDPAKKYPVVENIYAGPPGNAVPKAFGRNLGPMQMAELGFIVVQIDGMGTAFRSKAFQDYCWHDIGDAGFPDRILWIKAAAAKHPELDLSHGVGIYGTSAGGQNALGALIFHHDFYTVAVADCGCQDNLMDKVSWNEQWMGWPVGPWYDASSNVVHAKEMQGSLLLIVAELDHNVDPASTMQVCNALIQADKDFDLLVIPNADHGQDGAYGERRRRDFLVRHLMGVEPRRSPTNVDAK